MSVEREIERLRDPDPVVRTRAARALVFRSSGRDGPREPPRYLLFTEGGVASFDLPDPPPRRELSLEPGDPSAVGPLLAATDDPAKNVRTAVARALAVIGYTAPGREAREQLRAALTDENWRVRFAAVRAYSWLLNEPFEPLLPLLEAEQESLRWAAAVTIAGRRRGSFGHFFDLINSFHVRPLQEQFLEEPLLRALADASPTVRLAAIGGLDPEQDDRSYEPLVDLLHNDSDATVRIRAAGALRVERATPALVEALDDPSTWVRAVASRSLGQLKAVSAVEPLIAQLHSRKRYIRLAAAGALAEIGDDRAVEPLRALYERSTNERFRRDVLGALAKLNRH